MKKLLSIVLLLGILLVSFNFGKFLGIKKYSETTKLEDEIIKKSLNKKNIIKEENIVKEEKQKSEKQTEDIKKNIHKKVEKKKDSKVEEVRILAVGDIMFHMPQVNGAYRNGVYDFNNSFKYLKKYTNRNDINIANLETSIGGKYLGYKGYPNFNSPEEVLPAIKNAGFNLLNLSNNHILDQRREGLISTVEKVRANGFDKIGADDLGLDKHIIKDVRGIKIGFLSYTYGCNGMEYTIAQEDRYKFVNIIDESKIQNEIVELKKSVDFIIMYIHWGQEYQISPSEYQIAFGQRLLNSGVDIVLGTHPHVVQDIKEGNKLDDNKYIIYSMGNFLSNQRRESSQLVDVEDGVILELVVKKNFDTEEKDIESVKYSPTWVYKYSKNGKINHEIIPVEDALNREIKIYNFNNIETKLKDSYNRTINKLNKN